MVKVNRTDCVFCNYDKELYHETPDFIVFKPLEPVSDLHYLVCPKVHVDNYFEEDALYYWEKLPELVNELKSKTKVSSFKCVVNTEAPFQQVFHAHLHFIGFIEK